MRNDVKLACSAWSNVVSNSGPLSMLPQNSSNVNPGITKTRMGPQYMIIHGDMNALTPQIVLGHPSGYQPPVNGIPISMYYPLVCSGNSDGKSVGTDKLYTISTSIWRLPKMEVPPNHPLFWDFHKFSMVNHPAVGVPSFMETPIQIHVFDFHHSVVSYVCPNQSPVALGSLGLHGVLLKSDDISERENHMGNIWKTWELCFFFNAKTRFYPRDGHGDALWQTCDPNLELPGSYDKPTGAALTD